MRRSSSVALPDFPRVKATARRLLLRAVRDGMSAEEPLLDGIRSTRVHEGKAATLTRADASTDAIEFRAGTATLTIPHEQMRRVTVAQLAEHVRDMARQFADQQTALLLERVSEAAESVGNTISAADIGAKAAFLEMERRRHVDFDPDTLEPTGNFVMVVHPSQAETWKAQWEHWQRDPEFTAELGRIRQEQVEAWRAREARRRLAD